MLGQMMKERREELKLSVAQVADDVGVERQTVYAWESGVRRPEILNLAKWCEALQLDEAARHRAYDLRVAA